MSISFLSLLLGEFAGGNASSARYNLPLEFHRLCHHNFESGSDDDVICVNCTKSGLDATLHLSMTKLSCFVGHVINQQSHNPNHVVAVDEPLLELGSGIIDLTCDALSWEFGGHKKWDAINSFSNNGSVAGSTLLRPPQRWRDVLINPEFLGAMMNVYLTARAVMMGNIEEDVGSRNNFMVKQGRMAHLLRQLLLQLSSISGPIFESDEERGAYARFLIDGCLDVLELILNEQRQRQQQQHQPGEGSFAADLRSAEIVDLVTILSCLTTNFKMQILSQLHSFSRYLSALCTMGEWLLESSLVECQRVEGDVESMEGVDWRNDAIAQILHCSDTMVGDFWLVSGTVDSQEGQIHASPSSPPLIAWTGGLLRRLQVRRGRGWRRRRMLTSRRREEDVNVTSRRRRTRRKMEVACI